MEVSNEELDDIALESTRTIDIDEFVDKAEIDPRVGHDAFAVIRETIREMNKVAIGRVVLTNREHIIAPLDEGLCESARGSDADRRRGQSPHI